MSAPARPSSPLRAELIDARRVDPAGVAAWSALSDRAAESNPFLRPEFVLAASRERSDPVSLLVVRSGDRWLGLLPVRRRARWRRLPLPCLGPWLAEYAFLATPLVDRDAVRPVLDALLGFAERERRAAALVLDPVDPGSPVGRELGEALRARGVDPVVHADFTRAELRRRAQSTYLDEAASSSRRKTLRRQARALARELGSPLEVVDRASEPAAIERFLAMEAAGWKGEQGTAMASVDRDAAFFRSACAGLAAAGRLQLLALEAGGRTAAMQCNLVDGRDSYAFKVAYDPDLSRFSPGALLEVEAIEVFHREMSADRVDSCAAPDSSLINRLWPDRRRLQTLLVPTGAPHARLLRPAVRAEAAARRLRRAGRRARSAAAARAADG